MNSLNTSPGSWPLSVAGASPYSIITHAPSFSPGARAMGENILVASCNVWRSSVPRRDSMLPFEVAFGAMSPFMGATIFIGSSRMFKGSGLVVSGFVLSRVVNISVSV